MTEELARTGHVHGYDTILSVWEENTREEEMFGVFGAVCSHLHARGFTVRACPETQQRYPTLSRTTRVGRKGDLEYKMNLHGRSLEVAFFQNVTNCENPCGGYYDFNKLGRMTRTMRLQCLTEMTCLARRFLAMGYVLGRRAFPDPTLSLAFAVRYLAEQRKPARPLDDFNARWNSDYDWAKGGRFKRDETGWPVASEYSAYNTDRDKKPIRNFEVKYYRHWNGYLHRAQVFTNMNNMWMCESGAGRHYVSSRELFDCERPELLPPRLKQAPMDRLKLELEKALKAENYERVATLGGVMKRLRGVQREDAAVAA